VKAHVMSLGLVTVPVVLRSFRSALNLGYCTDCLDSHGNRWMYLRILQSISSDISRGFVPVRIVFPFAFG
jgi:hypothetical protein